MSPLIPEIGDVMTPGTDVVAPSESLARASSIMAERGIRHLPVVDEDELVGVLSDRDIARALAIKCASPESVWVEEAMTENPYWVGPDALLTAVARTMADRRIGSAIVVDRGAVLGVFTTTDALRALAETLEGRDVERVYESVPTAPPGGRRPHERDLR